MTIRPMTWLCAAVLAATLLPTASIANAQRRPIRDRLGNRGGEQEQSLQVDGRTRSYVLRTPRGHNTRSTAAPLVIVLHGGGGNAENAERMTGFTRLVERERILVAYPNGTGRQARNMLLTWNAGHCCASAMQDQVNDVAFIDALISKVSREYAVDASRIYVTGMSNGGMMSHRIGRELSHRIAAIAPVVGAVFGDEPPASSPVSAIAINGLLDESVPANGGPPGGPAKGQWDGTPARPNLDQGNYWARSNGCTATPASSDTRLAITWRWSCPTGLGVEVHQVKNVGHAWPGGQRGSARGDDPGNAMSATEVIWAFFKAHPKSRATGSPLKGAWRDDYNVRYAISDTLFRQGARLRYHVLSWHEGEQFLIARNDASNPADRGLYTRIDWMELPGMPPYTWAYCLTAYRAPSADSARATPPADRNNPRKGCNGFPFTRMARDTSATD